jgi:hypothetical protein
VTLKFLSFVKNNLLVALALILLGAGLGVYSAQQEINPFEYRILTNAWPHLHKQATADQIREAMQDGKIIRWENVPLWRAAIDDAGMLTSGDATEDVQTERQALQDVIKGGIHE